MNLRLRPYELLLKTFVCLVATLIATNAHGAIEETTTAGDGLVDDFRDDTAGLVEIHYPVDPDVPYKQRRETSAFLFGLTYESFYPNKYYSIIEANDTYNDLFGNCEIPMISLDLGYKYNFMLGALVAGVGMGIGRLFENRGEKTGDVYRTLEFTKYNAFVGYVMDSIFNEPYVAPYFNIGATNFGIQETAAIKDGNGTITESGTTQAGFYYRIGALVQLNWLEPGTARGGLQDFGMQNTYLDLFMTQYASSIQENDPDTETGINFGAGLRVEF